MQKQRGERDDARLRLRMAPRHERPAAFQLLQRTAARAKPPPTRDTRAVPAGRDAGGAPGKHGWYPQPRRHTQTYEGVERRGDAFRSLQASRGMRALPTQHELGELRRWAGDNFLTQN